MTEPNSASHDGPGDRRMEKAFLLPAPDIHLGAPAHAMRPLRVGLPSSGR